jgi:Short C-terminal domain
MSSPAGRAFHPVNKSHELIFEGFSWPCLLFGCFWFIYKGMWGWGIISFALAWITFGLSWLVFPFFANEQYAKSLLKKGYLNEAQVKERERHTQQVGVPAATAATPALSVADELGKLASLRSAGVLTDQEFESQKARLLNR